MARHVEILGETFAAVDFLDTCFFDLPCVYLMAHEEYDRFVIHYAGQTGRLNRRYAGHHQLEAARARGATHALVLVAPDAGDRRALETLLRWHFRPPLNAEETPTHMQAWRAAMHCGKADMADRARAAHLNGVQPMLPAATSKPEAAGR